MKTVYKVLLISLIWVIILSPLRIQGDTSTRLQMAHAWLTGTDEISIPAGDKLDPKKGRIGVLGRDGKRYIPYDVGQSLLMLPGKSIFIYDPLLIPCLLLGIILWKKLSPYIKLYLIANIFNFLLHLAFYSKLDFWHGDAAWGARYHVTSVHLLLIPLNALLIENLLSARGLYLWLIRLIIIMAIMVQIPSIVFRPSADTGRILLAKPESFMKFRLAERVISVGCLINDSFALDCQRRLAVNSANPLITKASLLPLAFTRSRNLAFAVWGLFLVVTIITTLRFYFEMSV